MNTKSKGTNMLSTKISVITVTYNAIEDLKITANSVLSQNYENIEYIIKDGASSDGTKDFLKTLDQKATVISSPDKGIYDAMNQAIDIATGDWVIFMNAGDEFFSNETLFKASQELDLSFDFIYGDRYRIETNGQTTYQHAGKLQDTLIKEVIYHQALFNKAINLKKRKYSLEYSLASDYHYLVSSYMEGKSFKYIEQPICNFKCGGRSRQQSLKCLVEALKISIDFQPDQSEWRRSDFFKNFILNNMQIVFQKELNRLSNKAGKNLIIENREKKLSITPESQDRRLSNLIEKLTEPLNQMNIKFKSEKSLPPKVTIITVIFNDKNGLARTIKSIKNLSYCNIEFIVIDGDSTDGSKDIIYQNANIIDYLSSEKDHGIYDAMNKGIDQSHGEFIIFMNAGDEFASNDVIEKTFSQANWQSSDIIYGDRFYISRNGASSLQKALGHENINKRMPFGHQSVFIRSSILKIFKFDTTYKSAADYNQIVHLYREKKIFEYIPIPICKFYAGGTSENGMLPYLEVLKIQIENFGIDDVKNNSVYYSGFKNNLNNFFE